VDPCNTSSISSRRGIARLSMRIHQVPSFFGVNNAGTAHGLKLSQTKCDQVSLELGVVVLDGQLGSFCMRVDLEEKSWVPNQLHVE
jgi:hypothetical protein